MRILLIGDYPADERLGSSKVLYRLREEFAALGHDAHLLLAPGLGGPSQRHVRDAISPWLAARAVARGVNGSGRFDVIDASSAEGVWLAWQDRAVVVARSHGLEHLNYRRMLDDARCGLVPKPWHRRIWYPMVRMRLVAAAARTARRLIVLTERDRQFAVSHGWKTEAEIDVIPHGLSGAFLQRPQASSPRPPDLLFCGSWDRVKGIDYLAAAFNRVSAVRPAARLTVLGPGIPAADVLGWFDPHARQHVTVVDRCGEEAVVSQYRNHRALVMSSTFEGFGMVIPEALSQGLAVIATPQGIAASLIVSGATGLVVPERDSEALASAMLRLIDEPALAETLGSRGRAAVQKMSWQAAAHQTLQAYARARAAATTWQ